MKLIQCLKGSTKQTIGEVEYPFLRDDFGRFVCEVYNENHARCFLSIEHYCEATTPPLPDDREATTPPLPDVAATDDGKTGIKPAQPPSGDGDTVASNNDAKPKAAATKKTPPAKPKTRRRTRTAKPKATAKTTAAKPDQS